jgi:hypothetical protein
MALVRSFLRRPVADRALVAHAIVVHLLIAALLRLIGLRRLTVWLAHVSRLGASPDAAVDPARVAWAVRTATHLLSAGRTCLTEALAAQYLLQRRGAAPTLRLGVSRVADVVTAHAWLEAAGGIVIGGDIADRYLPFAVRKEMP